MRKHETRPATARAWRQTETGEERHEENLEERQGEQLTRTETRPATARAWRQTETGGDQSEPHEKQGAEKERRHGEPHDAQQEE